MTLARLAWSMVSVASSSSPATVRVARVDRHRHVRVAVPGRDRGPLAGALLDRHGRARLVILDYLVAGAALALIAVLAALDSLPAPALVVIVAFAALTNPLVNSGVRTLLPVLVPSGSGRGSTRSSQLVRGGATRRVDRSRASWSRSDTGPVSTAPDRARSASVAAVLTIGIPDPLSAAVERRVGSCSTPATGCCTSSATPRCGASPSRCPHSARQRCPCDHDAGHRVDRRRWRASCRRHRVRHLGGDGVRVDPDPAVRLRHPRPGAADPDGLLERERNRPGAPPARCEHPPRLRGDGRHRLCSAARPT